jgi:hypothetical protein
MTRTVNSKRLINISSAFVVVLIAVECAGCAIGCASWQSVTVPLDSESTLRVSRKHTHPFLAEYQREVTVFHSGQRLATLPYPHDPGGGFPMQVRFYADATRRVVRITDRLYDRLIDLRTGQFVADETPPEGKESDSFIRETALPTLRRSVEIGSDMQLVQREIPQ